MNDSGGVRLAMQGGGGAMIRAGADAQVCNLVNHLRRGWDDGVQLLKCLQRLIRHSKTLVHKTCKRSDDSGHTVQDNPSEEGALQERTKRLAGWTSTRGRLQNTAVLDTNPDVYTGRQLLVHCACAAVLLHLIYTQTTLIRRTKVVDRLHAVRLHANSLQVQLLGPLQLSLLV